MEKYRETLKKQKTVYMVYAIALFLLFIVTLAWRVTETSWFMALPSNAESYIGGMLVGGGTVQFMQAHKISRTLRSAEALKTAFIADTDERNVHIILQSAKLTFRIVMEVLALAAIAAAFIDTRVCFTLLAVGLFVVLVWECTKLYYTRKTK